MQKPAYSVETTRRGNVFVVTLNRLDVRNAVDAATAKALHRAFLRGLTGTASFKSEIGL